MRTIKVLLITILGFVTLNGFGQTDSRINAVRELYKDYNETISKMDSYEIKYNTAGSYPSLTIFTDFSGKVVIKTADNDEFGSEYSEYYYKNDTIQFIFYKAERLLDHWGADTVRFKKLELRFYFDNGQIIKTLKKDYVGIEGKDDKVDLASIKNVETDCNSDDEVNWSYLRNRYKSLIKLYLDLKETF